MTPVSSGIDTGAGSWLAVLTDVISLGIGIAGLVTIGAAFATYLHTFINGMR